MDLDISTPAKHKSSSLAEKNDKYAEWPKFRQTSAYLDFAKVFDKVSRWKAERSKGSFNHASQPLAIGHS